MHNFEPLPDDDQSWDDEIQFLDLDPPGSSSPGSLLRSISEPGLLRKTRWWMVGVTVAGLLLLLVQAGYGLWPSGSKPEQGMRQNQVMEFPSSVLLATSQAVYTLDFDGNLNALRPDNGKLLWRYHPPLPLNKSVSVVDGVIYFIANNERQGTLYALQAVGGGMLWRYPLTVTVPTWFTVENNLVYVSAQNGVMYALSASNGGVVWQYQGDPSSISDPFVSLVDGILYICSPSEEHFVALQADNGKMLWRRDMPFAQVFLSAVEGVTYIGAGDGTVSALRSHDGSVLWRTASSTTQLAMNFSFAVSHDVSYLITQNGTLDARRAGDGALLWRFSPGYPIWGRLLLSDHVLYIGAYDGTIYALHDDGKLFWHYSTKLPVSLLSASSDQLFIQNDSMGDSIYALRITDGKLLWNKGMGEAAFFQSGAILVAGHMIYITTVDGTVNALRDSDGNLLWSRHILQLPQLLNGVLYTAAAQGGVSALSAFTGSIRWHVRA